MVVKIWTHPLLFMEKCGLQGGRGFTASPFATSIEWSTTWMTARVFLLGETSKAASRCEFPKAKAAKSDQRFIHSTFDQLPDLACDEPGCIHDVELQKFFEGETPLSGEQQCIACGSGSRWKLCRIDWSS